MSSTLQVEIRQLPPRQVQAFTCALNATTGNFSADIGTGFEYVKNWAVQQGFAASNITVIGVPHVIDGRLTAYECCVELPAPAPATPSDIVCRELPGGLYAVLTLAKDSATIGAAIGQFYAEYIPEHNLTLDDTRQPYEVYEARTMAYCVPTPHPTLSATRAERGNL